MITVRQKDVFVTTDKNEFDNREEAVKHDARESNAARIEAFLDSLKPTPKPRFRTTLKRNLLGYVAFSACHGDNFLAGCEPSDIEKEV